MSRLNINIFIIGIVTFLFINTSLLAEGFNFDSPEIGNAPTKEGGGDISLGSFGSISFGGLFDVRYIGNTNGSNEGAVGTGVHVDELVVTTNIGDNISILAEQLLPTSRLGGFEGEVGDDHGFVYAIFSNIPFTPSGTAFKIGRFRFKWGIDSVLDAPSNTLYPLVRKNLGFITDRGIQLSGFFGPIDYYLGLADGPEFVMSPVTDSSGNVIGTTKRNIENNTLPIFLRLNSKVLSFLRMGVSLFSGKSFPYTNFAPPPASARLRTRMPGGIANRTMLVRRHHGALDASLKWRKFDLHMEYSHGRDELPTGNVTTRGYFVRMNYSFKPQLLTFSAQYDRYDDGRPGVQDEQEIGAAIQYFIHDQAYMRLGYIFGKIGAPSGTKSLAANDYGFTQFYLPF